MQFKLTSISHVFYREKKNILVVVIINSKNFYLEKKKAQDHVNLSIYIRMQEKVLYIKPQVSHFHWVFTH